MYMICITWNRSHGDNNSSGAYHLEVFGPNGYFQSFKGGIHSCEPEIQLDVDSKKGGIYLLFHNPGNEKMKLTIRDNAYGYTSDEVILINPKKVKRFFQALGKSGNWYDFTVAADEGMEYRFAGRIETGAHTISDPAMAQHL